MRRPAKPSAPAFTLLETMLAVLLGGLVLAGVFGVLGAAQRGEANLAAMHRQTVELASLQAVCRRAFVSLLMSRETEKDIADELGLEYNQQEPFEPYPPESEDPVRRSRLILEPDTLAGIEMGRFGERGDMPQRLELVTSVTPLGHAVRTFAATDDRLLTADEAGERYADPQGGVRGVFELRPDGVREAFMARHGWGVVEPAPASARGDGGWTLWWRPMPYDEVKELTAGEEPTEEAYASRLARAVRLASGITMLEWRIFRDGEFHTRLKARAADAVPGYVTLVIETTRDVYADWMFEIGWTTGGDPNEPLAGAEEDEEGDEEGAAGGRGPRSGAGADGGRGGSGQRPRGGRPNMPDGPPVRRAPGDLSRPGGRGGGAAPR